MAKITVIIPVYNEEKYLPACLESVCGQTLQDIEIFCVDDGSTDSSLSILQSFQERDSRIRIVSQKNKGVFTARNLALKEGRGEFVAFMDADDMYPDNETLQILYEKAQKYHVLLAGGSMRHFDAQHCWEKFEGIFEKYTFTKERIMPFSDYQFDFGYQRFIFNRRFLIEQNIFFPAYRRFQDPPFFLKAMLLAGQFLAIPQVTYCYRVGVQPDPRTWPEEKVHDMMRGWIDVLRISREAKLPKMHAVAVAHAEDPYTYPAVMEQLRQENVLTVQLLMRANGEVDTMLLQKAKPDLIGIQQYVFKEWKDILQERKILQFHLNSMSNSLSFRIGRIITSLPRLLRDTLKASE